MSASVLIVISELVWLLSSPEAGCFNRNPFRLRVMGCASASLYCEWLGHSVLSFRIESILGVWTHGGCSFILSLKSLLFCSKTSNNQNRLYKSVHLAWTEFDSYGCPVTPLTPFKADRYLWCRQRFLSLSWRSLIDPGTCRTSHKWIFKQQAAIPADVLALIRVPISLRALIDCLLISYKQ